MPGTTSAVVYFRPTAAAALTVNFKTAAIAYIALRLTSGIFGSGGSVTTQDNAASLKAWLPSQRTPVTQADGTMAPAWYRFFDYLVNQKLGGAQAPTITDMSTSVASAQAAVTSQVATVAAIDAKTVQNASALAATVEVLKAAAVPGAAQIPLVDTAPIEQRGGE